MSGKMKAVSTGSSNLKKISAVALSVLTICTVSACKSNKAAITEYSKPSFPSENSSAADNKTDSSVISDNSVQADENIPGSIFSVEEQERTNEKENKSESSSGRSEYARRDEIIINENTGTPIVSRAANEIKNRRNEILNSGNTEENYKITGKKIYVSETATMKMTA